MDSVILNNLRALGYSVYYGAPSVLNLKADDVKEGEIAVFLMETVSNSYSGKFMLTPTYTLVFEVLTLAETPVDGDTETELPNIEGCRAVAEIVANRIAGLAGFTVSSGSGRKVEVTEYDSSLIGWRVSLNVSYSAVVC